jgi:transposase
MAGGRPTKYKPEFCEMLAEHFAEGYSYESFAGVVGVARATLYLWEEQHPEFLDAKKEHEAKVMHRWEERLAKLADSGVGNATAIIFGLKNRAGNNWRDKQEVAQTVKVEAFKWEDDDDS